MTKERLEDLAIGFDEYGFEPTILCDREAVIEEYRNAFTELLKDYERFEKLEKFVREVLGIYKIPSIDEIKKEKNVNLDFKENAEFQTMFKKRCDEQDKQLKGLEKENTRLKKILEMQEPKYILFGGARGSNKCLYPYLQDEDEEQSNDENKHN